MAPVGPQRSQGHAYADVHAHDQAYIHNGDIYNYRDASSEEKRVLEWLAPQSPSEDHNEALKQHEAGTFGWFFEDPRFTGWRDVQVVQDPVILWCRGQMGTGKTTLIAQVREHLHNREESRSGLAVAYCRYSKRNIQTAESILGSIIAQLYSRHEQSCNLPEDVVNAYHAQTWVSPRMAQLEEWLHARSKLGAPVFVLLDAIDELDILLIRRLLRTLQSSNLKLFVTSRDLPLLKQEFGAYTVIQTRASERDLRTMILARLKRESTRDSRQRVLEQPARGRFHRSVKEEVISKIMQSAGNMFLVATLHLNSILACNSVDEVYHYLDRFPAGLGKLYDEAWERATGDGESLTSQRAKLILMWVSVTLQPLSVATLAEALSTPRNNDEVAALLTEEEIVAPCAGLIRVEHHIISDVKTQAVVSLSHLSVQEYLDKNRQTYFPDADDVILVSSLCHLSSERLYAALSSLSGQYGLLTLFSIMRSEVNNRRHGHNCGWLHPEFVDFAVYLVLDLLTSVRFKSVSINSMGASLISPRFAPDGTLHQYFDQNLRNHVANARTITKVRLCLSLLYSRWPTIVGFGAWAFMSRCSRFFEVLGGEADLKPFLALAIYALDGREIVSQDPYISLLIEMRIMVAQVLGSIPIPPPDGQLLLVLLIAPVWYALRWKYARRPDLASEVLFPLVFLVFQPSLICCDIQIVLAWLFARIKNE